jgi:hypothetical protein
MSKTDFSKYPHIPMDIQVIVKDFESIRDDEAEPAYIRGYFHAILQMMYSGLSDYEQIISAAKELGYRLPAFDGDEMGRPADEEGWL